MTDVMPSRIEISLPIGLTSDGTDTQYPGPGSGYIKKPSGEHHNFLLEKVAKLWVETYGGAGKGKRYHYVSMFGNIISNVYRTYLYIQRVADWLCCFYQTQI